MSTEVASQRSVNDIIGRHPSEEKLSRLVLILVEVRDVLRLAPMQGFYQQGIRASRLSSDQLAGMSEIPISDLPVGTVRYWYAFPEPVYLVAYLEARDEFLAEDVREVIDRQGGMQMLAKLADAGQAKLSLKLRANASLDAALEAMPRHRSMRIDGPQFRGRPLGHRYDPLRSALAPLSPDDFDALVRRILAVHEFRVTEEVEPHDLGLSDIGRVTAMLGRLYLTYEWTNPLFTEFGYDEGSDFRIESDPEYAHGDVFVVIHSEATGRPRSTDDSQQLVSRLQARGITRALVFVNASDFNAKIIGAWRVTLEPLCRMPQGLGSIAFNVLTAPSVYLEFLDRLRWDHVNYL
jgi:hypothetical protein